MEQQPIFDPPFLNLEYFFHQIYDFFLSIYNFFFGEDGFSNLELIWVLIGILASILAILLIIGIIYSMVRAAEIHREEGKKIAHFVAVEKHVKAPHNTRWEKVLEYMESSDPNKWRLAIIEADAMLDDLVASISHQEGNLGERLKSMDKNRFTTLDKAWEAHKVRNKIAHEGSGYVLSRVKAERTIRLYEQVFKEFSYI